MCIIEHMCVNIMKICEARSKEKLGEGGGS